MERNEKNERWQNVGARIRYYRELAGMDQSELGVEAGLGGQTAVSKIESGKKEPHIDLLGAIALAFRSGAAKNPIYVTPEDLTRHTGWRDHDVKIQGVTARANASASPGHHT